MTPRQSQLHRRPQRRTSRSSTGGLGCAGFVFLAVIGLFMLNMLSSLPAQDYVVLLLIVGGVVALIYHNRQKKRQQELAHQQWLYQEQERQRQELAQQQWQRQEWERREAERKRQEQGRREAERQRQERERLAQLKSLGDILILTPTEFEELTGKLLQTMGYNNVQRVGGSGDLGIDLTALSQQGERVVVQCKRYAPGKSVSSPDIQKFIGMMQVHHKADRGIFVTTSTFTQPAIHLAGTHSISLIDGARFVQLVKSNFVP